MISKKQWRWFGLVVMVSLTLGYAFLLLPATLFTDPYSTVLEDRYGQLLNASIAEDGQWRFPMMDSVPSKYRIAAVHYEDRRFWKHPGVDVLALARAARDNFRAGHIVSGGSTLTMQVIKLSRKGRSRTYVEKLTEVALATRLELAKTKDEIFRLYAAHAPFGGNVVGLEAACWRYFGRTPESISWAEASLLAVLPNNPSLLRPGRNHLPLKAKRDRLLHELARAGYLDNATLALSVQEPLPDQPLPLPRLAPHLLDRAVQEGWSQQHVVSSLDFSLQQRAVEVVERHHQRLKGNQIHNAAVVVLDARTGQALAYIGNTLSGAGNQEQVDIIRARRSTGSILKPFLFAGLLDDGKWLSRVIMPDVPTFINGFMPKNYSLEYDGSVPLNQALIRSLNVPFVHALRDYRYEKFYNLLGKTGFTTFDKPADHYGLALVLGGGESTLWEITTAYGAMVHRLNQHKRLPLAIRDKANPAFASTYLADSSGQRTTFIPVASAAAIWETFEALKEVNRPGEETGWKYFSSSKTIAWKTGTSFGFRDGWAVGATPRYVVGVWVGNADGEGRPGLVGTETAAPLLFDIFALLPGQDWFTQPLDEMAYVALCRQSGHRLSSYCIEADSVWITRAGLASGLCRYHKPVHLTPDRKYQAHISCVPAAELVTVNRFVLPPIQEYYYKQRNLSYKPMPPFRKDCLDPATLASMDLIYPRPGSRVYIPRQLDGAQGTTVFEAAHRNGRAQIFWHLDGQFIGSTTHVHRVAIAPGKGQHVLSLVDESGQYLTRSFEVLSEKGSR